LLAPFSDSFKAKFAEDLFDEVGCISSGAYSLCPNCSMAALLASGSGSGRSHKEA
jgi:hypothetical protein